MSDEPEINGVPRLVTEKQIISKILKQYRKSPCLWDPSNNLYFNKQVRNDCYVNMLKLWKQLDPGATVFSMKRKLEHYRAAYRRERKKVECCSVAGEVYVPTLWYYKYLTFLNNDGKCDDSTDSADENEEKLFVYVPPEKKRRTSPVAIFKQMHDSDEDLETYDAKWNEPGYVAEYAKTLAKQLKELDKPERYEAERIISDVVYRARTGTLPKYTPQVVDTLVIPDPGPSWYDVPLEDPQPENKCISIVNVNQTVDETNAV